MYTLIVRDEDDNEIILVYVSEDKEGIEQAKEVIKQAKERYYDNDCDPSLIEYVLEDMRSLVANGIVKETYIKYLYI